MCLIAITSAAFAACTPGGGKSREEAAEEETHHTTAGKGQGSAHAQLEPSQLRDQAMITVASPLLFLRRSSVAPALSTPVVPESMKSNKNQ